MSITLPANLISSLTIGGVNTETDANYAVTGLVIDFTTNVMRFTVRGGTTTGQLFAAGTIPPVYEFFIDLTTGKWFVNGAPLSGVIGGATLTNIKTVCTNLRNNTESFAVNQNLLPGASQVAWT